MKIVCLLLCATLLSAQPRYCSWNCSGVPLPNRHIHRAPTYRSQVPTSTAVASAIATGAIAGIIGYQLGKKSQLPQPTEVCKTVQLDGEKRIVCKDSQGRWSAQ